MSVFRILSRFVLIAVVPVAMVSAVVEQAPIDFSFGTTTDLNEFKVMTYNVTNLFDADHDDGKNDYAFLPKGFPGKQEECERIRNPYYKEDCLNSDWTNARIKLKIAQIKRVLTAQGDLPDVLALQEVENENVVSQLAKGLGYSRFVMTNSPDKRGIDVALLFNETKLVYLSHDETPIVHDKIAADATRNFLRVVFAIRNDDSQKKIAFYVNHWPAAMAPTYWRNVVASQLRDLIDQHQQRFGPANYHSIVLGDFNTQTDEFPTPFYSLIFDKKWLYKLSDAHDYARRFATDKSIFTRMPPGTYWYIGENVWHRFDRIFVSPNLIDKFELEVVPDSYRIVAPSMMRAKVTYTSETHYFFGTTAEGIPYRYNHNTDVKSQAGFSDHFPVTLKVRFKN
jgi:endonuclease/exonuclease/phosphatase family metal-dependent hydrolase